MVIHLKYLLMIMFFFTLTGCRNEKIEIEKTNQIILNKDIEFFELDINTKLDNIVLINVENNDKFEYELIKTDTGYKLYLTVLLPQSFSNITIKSNDKEYICNIGKIEILEYNLNDSNYINIVTDDNDLYIYNKLDKFIELEEIKVFGGDYLQSINFSKFIDPKKLTKLGNIYSEVDSYVIYIKFKYGGKRYEQYLEIKNLTNN